MPQPRLVIGQKRYSSWSLRPWLVLRHAQIPFEEISVAVEGIGFNEKLLSLSPSGLVPVLHLEDGSGDMVFDSLALAEWAHERSAAGTVWPADVRARTHARCIAAEMHSGFADVRALLSMNLGFEMPSPIELPPRVAAQVTRIIELWRDARARFGAPSGEGPYLFGKFSAADAMYAPVAFRFKTYGVSVTEPLAAEYLNAMLAHPLVVEWRAAALVEKEGIVAKYDDHLIALGAVRVTV